MTPLLKGGLKVKDIGLKTIKHDRERYDIILKIA